MNFSIFDGNMAGTEPVADYVVRDGNGTVCNCLYGRPVLAADGSCGCSGIEQVSQPANTPPPVTNTKSAPPTPIIYANSPAAMPPTIFGLPRNVVLIGAAVAALFMFNSASTGSTGKNK